MLVLEKGNLLKMNHPAGQQAYRVLGATLAMPMQRLRESKREGPRPSGLLTKAPSWRRLVLVLTGVMRTTARTESDLFNPPNA